jgi:hypothetical protein
MGRNVGILSKRFHKQTSLAWARRVSELRKIDKEVSYLAILLMSDDQEIQITAKKIFETASLLSLFN